MKSFLHGTTYYHYANQPDELQENFEKMQRMGLNCVRTAEIWPGWEQLEPTPGKYDFSLLDDFVRKTADAGLMVVMGIGINDPPFWLFDEIPDLRCRDGKGQLAVRRVQSADLTNPLLQQAMERFIRVQASHYAANNNIVAWQLGNEMRLGVNILDTCSARLQFRDWLRNKYNNEIAAINSEWGTFYCDWSSIYPYKSAGGAPTEGITPLYLATVEFQCSIIENIIRMGCRLVREYSDKPVFHNNFSHSGESGSHWRIAADTDWVVQDIYPTLSQNPPVYNTFLLDCAISISRSTGKPLLIGETSVSQYGTYSRNRPEPKQIEAMLIEMLGCGISGLLNFQHKSPKFEQPHKFTGSQAPLRRDGSENVYAKAIYAVSDAIARLNLTFDNCRPAVPDVGIYYPEESIILSREAGFMDIQLTSVYGASTLWNRLGYSTHLMPTEQLITENLENMKIIHLPVAWLLPNKVGLRLREYVQSGGMLIASCRPGYVDDSGWLYKQQPGAGLAEVFGATEDLFWNQPEFKVKMQDNKTFYALQVCQTLRLNGAAPVFSNDAGEIIGSINRFGSGTAILLGFAPELNFPFGGGKYGSESIHATGAGSSNSVMLSAIAGLMAENGITPEFQLAAANAAVTIRRLDCGNLKMTVLMNHGADTEVVFHDAVETILASDGVQARSDKIYYMKRHSWVFIGY